MDPTIADGAATISVAHAPVQYAAEHIMKFAWEITGFDARAFKTSRANSVAPAHDPPGESQSRTTVFTCGSATAARSWAVASSNVAPPLMSDNRFIRGAMTP